MKKILYSLLLMILVTGCFDDLDRLPLDKLVPETYFNNEEELRTYTNKFYNTLPAAQSGYGETVDAVCSFRLADEIRGSRTIPTTGGGWYWGDLRDINLYLQYSHRCSNVAVRKKYDGLAYFFRANFYFEKVKRFGDVPWYNKPLMSDDPALYKARDSRVLVMDSVLQDIDRAILQMSDETSLFRATKWTALALKSRICLFEGTYRKYHGIEGYEYFLDECIKASEEFMRDSPYRIYKTGDKPYRDLFASMEAQGSEVILGRNYDKSKQVLHEANYNTLATTYGRPGVNKKIINSYLMADGTRFTDKVGYDKMEYFEEMQNRDPRLTQTVVGPGYKRIGGTSVLSPNFSSSMTGYQVVKWVTSEDEDGYMNSWNDYILFRTSEVYLNFAEAKAERGTLTQTDLDNSIKEIRDRVGMPNIDMAYANANPDPYLDNSETGYTNIQGPNKGVILEIRRERSIELILEGHRYYDIMRWKQGKLFENQYYGMYFSEIGPKGFKVYDLNGNGQIDRLDVCLYKDTKPSGSEVKGVRVFLKLGEEIVLSNGTEGNILAHDTRIEPRTWDETRDYLYPIPTQERVLTNGVITQNPNWKDGLNFD